MGRYLGPKGRVNRRLNSPVYESHGAIKALEKKEYPPGMHRRRKKATNYGIGLNEKQKIRFYYGLREKQLRRYFEKARRLKGNTGEQMLILCERRLDNVVRKAGFATSRPQARQGIVHGHFQLNGRTVTKPSIQVRPGDIVTVKNRPNLQKMYKEIVELATIPQNDWIMFEPGALRATVTAVPSFEDVQVQVDIGQVVAFMSR